MFFVISYTQTMNIKYAIYIVALLLSLYACQQTSVPGKEEVVEKQVDNFPEDWLGIWKGQLVISKPNGDTTQIPMQLHLLENDTLKNGWDWTIIYGADVKKGTRAYTLYKKDKANGHYVIDENNGIVLDAYYLGNTLYSRFSVMGSLLTSMETRQGNTMTYTIISGKEKPINTTGGQDDIPEVGSYNIVVEQQAILRRE